MYSKLEILEIYNNCSTTDEVFEVSKRFKYLFDYKFMIRSKYVFIVSSLRFRAIVKNQSL